MIGDKVKIIKRYCADDIYVGLKGIIIEEFNDLTHARRIKVNIPKDDKKYWLSDKPIFPLHCLKKITKEQSQ